MKKEIMMESLEKLGKMPEEAERNLTWLDKILMEEEKLDEKDVRRMHPAEKVELYLNLQGIVGYGNDIIRAVAAAYNVNLPT